MALRNTIAALSAFALLITPTIACHQPQTPMMAPPTTSNLKVHIEPATAPSTLKVTMSNTHESTPLTVLQWDVPFTRDARDSGIYHIQPVDSDTELESLNLRKKRKVPPPREDLFEIPAQGEVVHELLMEQKGWIPKDGGRYKVWAKGTWRAVWTKAKADITDEDLSSLLGGDFGQDAEWETNVVEMTLGEQQ